MTQAEALSILTTGANVFLTGEPGSGKTHTVNAYSTWLRERGIEPAITASTGIAATHVGGMTIHAWSGIGVLSDLSQYDLDRISSTERVARRVRNAAVLIIDEISMLSANTLSLVDAVCREIRGDQRAFGGMQVVFVGDFFQLPPVSRSKPMRGDELVPQASGAEFAFSSFSWKKANPLICYLSEQYRQADEEFLAVLSAIRSGRVTEEHRDFLLSREVTGDGDYDEEAETTRLFSHNADVDRMNDAALARLSGLSRRYEMEGKGPDHLIDTLKRGCLSPECLILKPGSRVMFTKNDPMGTFANGTLGTVIGFSGPHPLVEITSGEEVVAEPMEWKMEDAGKVLAKVTQVPLRLAWAITVHKSQGITLESALIDLSKAFEYGQGYVALSRVRNREGLTLLGLNKRALEVHPVIKEKDEEFRELSNAVRDSFAMFSEEELKSMQKNFIRAAGGVEVPYTPEEIARPKRARDKEKRLEATRLLVVAGKTLAQIAKERDRAPGTILDHLEELLQEGKLSRTEIARLAKGHEREIAKAQSTFLKSNDPRLSSIHQALGGKVSYELIRLARMLMGEY